MLGDILNRSTFRKDSRKTQLERILSNDYKNYVSLCEIINKNNADIKVDACYLPDDLYEIYLQTATIQNKKDAEQRSKRFIVKIIDKSKDFDINFLRQFYDVSYKFLRSINLYVGCFDTKSEMLLENAEHAILRINNENIEYVESLVETMRNDEIKSVFGCSQKIVEHVNS